MIDKPSPLFRHQAVHAKRSQWLGPVILAPSISHMFYAVFALITVLALVSIAAYGGFTRKARVNGWLVPKGGMVRVFAQQPGVIDAIKVSEGMKVKKDQVLLILSAERKSSALGSTQAEITRLLQVRRASLENEIRQQELLFKQQSAGLARRVDAIGNEIEQFSREIALQASRADLSSRSTERLRTLQRSGFVSMVQFQQQEELELEQRGRLRLLERTRAERQREGVTLKAELDDLPIKSQTQLANLSRDIRSLEQELAESEARREIVISAPHAGIVASIQAEAGGHATTSAPLLSIVPEGAQLEAHLYAPSRSVGFVRPGQEVLLRYQSFPYQKFGHYKGTVASVSRSSVTPTELPTQLLGLTSLIGTNEPIYRIDVQIERQAVLAYGVPQPLQPGMQLESDVLLERRRLWEWMLEPLFTLTGKL